MTHKTGHSGQADTAGNFPIGFPWLVIGDAHALKKLGWFREHAQGDKSFRLVGQTMANGAMFFIDFRALQKIRFVRGYGRIWMGQFIQIFVQPELGKCSFERHARRGCGDRRLAPGKIQIAGSDQY